MRRAARRLYREPWRHLERPLYSRRGLGYVFRAMSITLKQRKTATKKPIGGASRAVVV